MAALLLLLATAAAARLGDLARRDHGDVFTLLGESCGAAQCAEHGAGARADSLADCACACPQRAPLFREDRELCVDDLPECSLATFGTGVGVQRIPFVYLPLKGQIIHPSREITFQSSLSFAGRLARNVQNSSLADVKTPICAVSGAQFLTTKGFLDLRNTLDADVPFSLFRDEGRTFLQWTGEDELRTSMSGRVMVVRLLCRDVDAAPASPLDLRGVFTPCVAFRVQGTPPKHISNVTEVQFAPNAQTSEASNSSGLAVTEYVAIGISSLLLGLIYVASVFLFLHIRKRRRAASEEGTNRRLKGLKKKDGSAITERDIIRINNERVQTLSSAMGQDEGVVKKNPLLNMGRQFHDIKSNFPSDSGSNVSDSDDFGDNNKHGDDNILHNQTTSAVVHLRDDRKHHNEGNESHHRDETSIERLPDEHVSIVETTDDREIARPVGTTRRKLYFNPAYFEPHLMAEPPPAALEFLTKIREVIAIAKHKMAAKRFQPVLNEIPEEETFPSKKNSFDSHQELGSQRSSAVSLKRENSRKKSVSCVGCPGCKSENGDDLQSLIQYEVATCSNCLGNKGDKQNSIRKWLENIPTLNSQSLHNELLPNTTHKGLVNSLLSLPISQNGHKIRKQNSFSSTEAMNLPDRLVKSRKLSTMSVKSEPPPKNYNLPLPEFYNSNNQLNNYKSYCQTVSRVDDIRPIGLSDYRTGSLRCSALENHRRNKFITNKNALPDMVNEAIVLDNFSKSYNHSSSDDERFTNNQNNARNRSESPSGNDYETDSLERNSHKKGIVTPTDFTEVPSSQASPSLSNALPLEEELTMRNAIYKHSSSTSNTPSPQRDIFIDQNHYETIGKQKKQERVSPENKNEENTTDYSLVSEVYVNNNYNFDSRPTSPSGSECSIGSRKLNCKIASAEISSSEEKPGCLTIEVKDPPENYIKIHESDDFEPDTLDRKHQKHKQLVENIHFSRRELIKNIDEQENTRQQIQLRSSGTFRRNNNKVETATKFNSLRNEYELRKNSYDRPKLSPTTFSGSKSLGDASDDWEETVEWTTEEGRILTLELRHSKRQRQCTPPTIKQLKNLARPDILPPLPPADENHIYEQPNFPPRKVEDQQYSVEYPSKNATGRSLNPRTSMNSVELTRSNSKPYDINGPSCSSMRASVESQSSDYENVHLINRNEITERSSLGDFCKNFSTGLGSSCNSNEINTATFVKVQKTDGHPRTKFRRRKGTTVEDSGYLSSDSACSRQVQRKVVVAKIVSCSEESDDTENEARSESGAESVETHSVYFGSFRKLQANENVSFNKNIKGARGSSKRKRLT